MSQVTILMSSPCRISLYSISHMSHVERNAQVALLILGV